MISPLFVFSSGRSGTCWVAEQLTKRFGDRARVILHNKEMDWLPTIGGVANTYAESEDMDYAVSVLEQIRKEHVEKTVQENKRWVEVSLYAYSLVRPLSKLFPDAQFIYLHRNPRQVVASQLVRDSYGQLRQTFCPPRDTFQTGVGKLAAVWAWENHWLSSSLAGLRHFPVGLDDLLRNHDVYNRMLDHIGLGPLDRYTWESDVSCVVNRSNNPPRLPREWNRQETFEFLRATEKVCSILGYVE